MTHVCRGSCLLLALAIALIPVDVSLGQGLAQTDASPAAAASASDAADPEPAVPEEDAYGCQAPYEVPYDLPSQDHAGADAFAWQTFLGLNHAYEKPIWTRWNSTVDLINCNQIEAPAGGTCIEGHFFPEACTQIEGYSSYQVLDQAGKVDDLLLEAESKGLSGNPVIAANGTFLRYQILISSTMSSWILGQKLQRPETLRAMHSSMTSVIFPCSDPKIIGTNMQSTVLKLAWMDLSGWSLANDEIYRQDILVFTPSWLSSRGVASCEKKTMGLVGIHVARKTVSQPGWVWATFEHAANAPDCTALPSMGNAAGSKGASKSCPETVQRPWNLYPATCQKDTAQGACQACNTVPRINGEGHLCFDPEERQAYLAADQAYDKASQAWVAAGSKGRPPRRPTEPKSWCLDLPPAAELGISRLCRQVAPGDYYPGVSHWDETPPNKACRPSASVWSQYQLIGTQWTEGDLSAGGSCPNVQAAIWHDVATKTYPVVDHDMIKLRLSGFDGDDGSRRPFLANTTMESYERSNCMGCHSKSTLEESIDGQPANLPSSTYDPKSPGTDFIYFLGLEVPASEAASPQPSNK